MQKDAATPQDIQEPAASPKKRANKKATASSALKLAQEALAAADDKYLRLYSEFDNFKRRTAKEKLTLLETASKDLLQKLLPVVDDFERALAAMDADEGTNQAMQQGVQLIYDKLQHLLQQAGVAPMPLEKGGPFDTDLHEAVTQLPTADPTMKGKVLEVIQQGYLLHKKVLRFAKVVTGA